MTEKFINVVFKDLKCLLKVPAFPGQIDLEPSDASKDILHTFE